MSSCCITDVHCLSFLRVSLQAVATCSVFQIRLFPLLPSFISLAGRVPCGVAATLATVSSEILSVVASDTDGGTWARTTVSHIVPASDLLSWQMESV